MTGRMLAMLPAERAAALAEGPVTIDLDTTDVEVYGRKKRGVAWNHLLPDAEDSDEGGTEDSDVGMC